MQESRFENAEATLQFELKLETNVRLKNPTFSEEQVGSHNIVTPIEMCQQFAELAKQAAKRNDDADFEQQLEAFVTYRLFALLGIRAVPPTLIDGIPSDEDFEMPDIVKVVNIKHL
jgi:hypothetical protein